MYSLYFILSVYIDPTNDIISKIISLLPLLLISHLRTLVGGRCCLTILPRVNWITDSVYPHISEHLFSKIQVTENNLKHTHKRIAHSIHERPKLSNIKVRSTCSQSVVLTQLWVDCLLYVWACLTLVSLGSQATVSVYFSVVWLYLWSSWGAIGRGGRVHSEDKDLYNWFHLSNFSAD